MEMSVLGAVLGSNPAPEFFSPQQRETHAKMKADAIARLTAAFRMAKAIEENEGSHVEPMPQTDANGVNAKGKKG